MKLPNAELAIVEMEKLVEYCLNPDHPRGKHKARVFQAACGFNSENASLLRDQLLEAAGLGEATAVGEDAHGRRYVIEYLIAGPGGRAWVRTAWIVRSNEEFPRFVTAYVL